MASTPPRTNPLAIESDVRAFAAAFRTPNVQRLIALCESGAISWDDAYSICYGAITAAQSDAQATLDEGRPRGW